jgi:hypothetical protein
MGYKRRNLITGLIGLALLGTPIAAAAKDNDRGPNTSHQSQAQSRNDAMSRHELHISRSYNMPLVEPGQHESGDQHEARTFNTAPLVADRRDRHEDRRERNRWNRVGWRHDRRHYNYDHDRGYYGDYASEAPYYVMPRGYAGGSCAWARHLRNVYTHDRYTGHPAAAADLLPRLHRAERACGGVRYGYNRYHRYWR